jgi:two-component system OmpR family response regulator
MAALQTKDEPYPAFRVLCVDDNRDVADSTARLFTIVGFEARACYDGPSALKVAETFLPSVCILDLNMPGMDGAELATRLREQPNNHCILTVAMTAMSGVSHSAFDMYLVKPVDPTKLLEIVNSLFEQSSATAARRAIRL